MWPDMRLPWNTRPGVWRWPMEPGVRCDTETPCEAWWPAKLWRFMVPAKPLPMVVPVTSTIGAGLEEVGLDLGAGRELGCLPCRRGGTRPAHLPGATLGLGVVAGDRLRQQLRTTLAEGHLHGAIAVLVRGLHLSDAVRQHFDDGYGNGLAGIREHARHAGLAADQTRLPCQRSSSSGVALRLAPSLLISSGELGTTGEARRRAAS